MNQKNNGFKNRNFFSCLNIGSDVFLFRDLYFGTKYRITVPHPGHDWVQPKNLTAPLYGQLVMFENITNFCDLVGTEDVGLNKTSYTFSCFEQDPYFAILTLFFILNTAHTVIAVFFRKSCSDHVFFVVSIILGLCLLCHPPADIYYLWGIFSLLMGISSATRQKNCICSGDFSFSLIVFILYPALIVLSPLLMIIMKFRFIFPINRALFWQKQILAQAEATRESMPQLTLQLYIVFTRFYRAPSYLQILVIVSSLLAITLTNTDEFLVNIKLAKLNNILIYFPYFFLENAVTVIKVSLFTSLFHGNGYIIIFSCIVIASVLGSIIGCVVAPKEQTDARLLIVKTSNILTILAIISIINLAPDLHLTGDTYLGWDKLPLVEDVWSVNTILSCLLAGELLFPLVKFAYQRFGRQLNLKFKIKEILFV